MLKSSDRILTSHAGSLPRPDDLITVNAQREAGQIDEGAFQKKLTASVADVVKRQVAAGITVPGDGEYGKSMGSKVNYRAWWSYSFTRLSGLRIEDVNRDTLPVHRSSPGNIVLSTFADRRDRIRFRTAYADPELGITTGPGLSTWPFAVGAREIHRPRRHRRRHRQLQGGPCGQRRARGLHDLDRPRELRAGRQSSLQERR